ncbi:MAG: alkaline phosphatase family protein [Alistipes sp.]
MRPILFVIMKHPIFLFAIAALAVTEIQAAKPRLVVNIVVSSMRAEELDRCLPNCSDGGLRRLVEGGTLFTDCSYDYQQTTTPVSLATLTTGAMPSSHGVIGARWQDYVENKAVALAVGRKGIGPYNLVAPTFAETLRQHAPDSKAVTIAAEATSAVVMSGRGGETFWIDSTHCGWITSPYYAAELPTWIADSNREKYNLSFIAPEWRTLLERNRYTNIRNWDITLSGKKKELDQSGKGRLKLATDFERLLYTPAGNSAVLSFAKQAVAQYKLGADTTPDLLNICLDASRHITESYGPESVEVEDMFYRLDRDLADFFTFLFAQVKNGEVLIVLTSDHGTSPSFDAGREEVDRFNTRQFEVIVNGFLNVRYGVGSWVLEYENKCIYLNHNLIYERGLDLASVQNEVAIFAMQFRGVSHALSATAMRTSYFGSGYARKMQNSFYPRRSGDVILNLIPGWIELDERNVSASGSLYHYDTDVPLIFYGTGAGVQRITRHVDMTSVAPTLSRIVGISAPAASEGDPLPEIVNL